MFQFHSLVSFQDTAAEMSINQRARIVWRVISRGVSGLLLVQDDFFNFQQELHNLFVIFLLIHIIKLVSINT